MLQRNGQCQSYLPLRESERFITTKLSKYYQWFPWNSRKWNGPEYHQQVLILCLRSKQNVWICLGLVAYISMALLCRLEKEAIHNIMEKTNYSTDYNFGGLNLTVVVMNLTNILVPVTVPKVSLFFQISKILHRFLLRWHYETVFSLNVLHCLKRL